VFYSSHSFHFYYYYCYCIIIIVVIFVFFVDFDVNVNDDSTSFVNMFELAPNLTFGVLLCMTEYSVHLSLLRTRLHGSNYYDMIHEYLCWNCSPT
jgi:hypothetical protein